jgi:diguanylate cyclase (GGDEF)-like protein/PAS domain S-box-containing protein
MKFIRFCLLVCALACLPAWTQPAPSSQTGKASELNLTATEKAWLNAHPVIRVGMDPDYAPYEWVDKDGQYVGLAVDYLRRMEPVLGVRFDIVKGKSWVEAIEMSKRGELDLLSSIVKTPERAKFLAFSEPYRNLQTVIIDHGQGGFIGSLAQLTGQRVVVEKGYFTQELLTQDHPDIQLVIASSTQEALSLLLDGKADAYVGDLGATNYAIKKTGRNNLRFSGQTEYQSQHRFAAAKANTELASLLNKAMATIPADETAALFNRWMGLQIVQGIQTETLLKYGSGLALLFLLFGYWVYRLHREINDRKAGEARIHSILDTSLDAVISMNAQGQITDWNTRAETMFGWTKSEALGRMLDETVIPPQHRAAHRHGLARFMKTQESHVLNRRVEMTALRRNGEEFPIDLSISFLKKGDTTEFNAFIADTSERQQRTDKLLELTTRLKESETLYRLLTEDAMDVLWRTDCDLHITYISPADERVRGYRADEVIGRHVFDMFTPEGVATVKQVMQQRLVMEQDGTQAGVMTFEVQHRCKDGRLLWGEVLSKPERDASGAITGYHGITREITERKHMQDQVRQLAFYDPLTQLPNRRLLNDRLSQAMAAGKRTGCHGALMVLDLDNFKSLNDAHGHLVGDLLLIEVARRLSACVREMDTVARFGGDEFVVMLSELSSDRVASVSQAGLIAEDIRLSLSAPYRLDIRPEASPETTSAYTVEHHCTASIGVFVFMGTETSQTEVLKQADAAMYQAKDAGRNLVRLNALSTHP